MLQVVSYCRVSTDKEDQSNSFEAQQRYFKEYISRRPDWELYGTYADEGITGTSTKKRVQFNRMIQDAYKGKFGLIITKEVSRFSRNILDTIAFTRELKELGIGVLFMNDGINSLDSDAELRLSIMASIAQEESRKTSSRVKWGQTRQMERGVVFGHSMLGYDVKDGKMTVNPEGAEIVKQIFYKYGVEKKGTSVIAEELRRAGYLTASQNEKWSNTHIIKILKNEKYAGDLIQKKTITPDYLTHEKKYNHGEEEMVVIRNHHEAVIERELWDTVQAEIEKRNVKKSAGTGGSNRYIFSGKIKCGACGASFVSRKKYRKDAFVYRCWGCYTAAHEGRKHFDEQGKEVGCNIGKMLRDDLALKMLKTCIKSLQIDTKWMINNVTALAADAIYAGEEGSTDKAKRLEYEIRQITKKKEELLDAFLSKDITGEEMQMMKERYDGQLVGLKARLEKVRAEETAPNDSSRRGEEIRKQVSDIVACKTENEAFYKNLLDKMIVYPDSRVEVKLRFLPQTWLFLYGQPKDLDTGVTF